MTQGKSVKIKVFATIFISFLLVMMTSSVGRVVGEKIKYSASEAIVDRALGEDRYSVTSKTELFELASSEQHRDKFSSVNREVSQEYRIYFIINLVTQGLIFLGIAIGASYIVIRVIRNARS